MKLVIVDTGCANIASVRYAIERLGYKVNVSDQVECIQSADRVFLPGVGTANAAMQQLELKNLTTTLSELTQPVLGICLGMQLLCAHSDEGNTDCLKLINTNVATMKGGNIRLPHMGWDQVYQTANNPLFSEIETGSYFYFVHGYAVPQGDYTIADCHYGSPFSASINRNNFYGVQFHPERSGKTGAKLLQNFIENL